MLNKALRSKGASIAISSVMIMQTIAFMSAGVSADTADEKIENFVKRCYTVTLGREGEAEGIAFWTDQLASGNMVGSYEYTTATRPSAVSVAYSVDSSYVFDYQEMLII